MAEKRAALVERNHEDILDSKSNIVKSADSSDLVSFSNLDHFVFFWTIENCSFLSRSDIVESPLFSSDSSSSTSWTLQLDLSKHDGKDSKALLDLVRHDFDENCEDKLFVNCYLTVENSENELIFAAATEHVFGSECRKSFELSQDLFERLCTISEVKDDSVIIKCEMFTQPYESSWKDVQSVTGQDRHLLQLSRDFSDFLARKEAFDFCLMADDGEVKAHKAILGARSVYFFDSLLKEKGRVLLSPGLRKELLQKILLYVYSGVFEFSGFKRSDLFTLHRFAEKFELHSLMEFLQPNKTMASTVIRVESCDFKWSIRDFEFHQNHSRGFVRSPDFNCGNPLSPETWYLRLNFVNPDDRDYIGIELGVSGLRRKILVSAVISNLNSGSSEKVHLVWEMQKDQTTSFSRFLRKVNASDSYTVSDDTLSILCNLKFSDMTANQEIVNCKVIHSRVSGFEGRSLRKLSDDFYRLQEYGTFSDLEIKSGGKKFSVHKPVLFARWPDFKGKFEELHRKDSCCFMDIKSFAMKKIIVYLYSGRVNNMDPYEAIDIYLAAEKLNLNEIKTICSTYLRSHLDMNIMSDVLVLANEVHDMDLQSCAIDYIYTHWNQISSTAEWKNLVKEWPNISREIYSEIRRRNKAKNVSA